MSDSSQPKRRVITIVNAGDTQIQQWQQREESEQIAQLRTKHGNVLRNFVSDESFDAQNGDLYLFVDLNTTVVLVNIRGDCIIDHVAANITMDNVTGDMTLKKIQGDITITSAKGDLFAREVAGAITCSAIHGDTIFSFINGPILIDNGHGDCTLSQCETFSANELKGDLQAQRVQSLQITGFLHGDATIHQCSDVRIRQAKGDCTFVKTTGQVTVDSINGDTWVRDTSGNCVFEQIEGSLYAQNLSGNFSVNVKEDCFIETALEGGKSYTIVANKIIFRVQSPINAQFVVQAELEDAITTHLPLQVDRHRQNLVGIIGKGEATVTLFSHGNILLDSALQAKDSAESGKKDRPKVTIRFDGQSIILDPTDLTEINKYVGGFINKQFGDIAKDFGFRFNTDHSRSTQWEQQEDTMSTQEDPKEFEERLKDLSDRSSRAARKAAEKIREYGDKAMSRARETDWEAVGREVRTAIEHTISELEVAVKEIVSEFQAPQQNADAKNSTVDSKNSLDEAQSRLRNLS